MATVDIANWDEKNPASIGTLSDGTSFTGLTKVQPVKVTWGNSSSSSGTGVDCEFTVSISSQDELVVTQSDESTTRPYEVALFDTSNNVAWLWVYGSWNSDGSNQVVVGAGTGDGTDYSSPRNASGTNGTGSNPWGQSGINSIIIAHFEGLDSDTSTADTIFDSSPNANNGTANGAIDGDGQIGRSGHYDGNDDNVNFGNKSSYEPSTFTIAAWINSNITGQQRIVDYFNYNGGGYHFSLRDWSGDGYNQIGLSTDDGGGNGVRVHGSTSLSNNTWYTAGITYDTGSGQAFLDGSLDGSDSGNQYASTSVNWLTAKNNQGTDRTMDGEIDEVRFYSEVKSSNWFTADYDASPKGGQTFFSWNGAESTSGGTVLKLAASGTGAGTGTSSLRKEIHFVGAGTGNGVGNADMFKTVFLGASGTGKGAGTGSIQRGKLLKASGTGTGTGSGDIFKIVNLGASGTGIGTGVSDLFKLYTLAASGAATGTGTSSLIRERHFVASGTGLGAGSASLEVSLGNWRARADGDIESYTSVTAVQNNGEAQKWGIVTSRSSKEYALFETDGEFSYDASTALGTTSGGFTQGCFAVWIRVEDKSVLRSEDAIRFRAGSSSSDYVEWTLDKDTIVGEGTYLYYVFNHDTYDEVVGTPDWTATDFFQITFFEVSGNTTDTSLYIDYLTVNESSQVGLNPVGDRRGSKRKVTNG